MLSQLYRTILPLQFREFIYSALLGKILRFKRNFHILYPAFLANTFGMYKNTEPYETYKFIGQHGLRSCPGDFSLKYDGLQIGVLRDTYPYVMHTGKKLYFPEKFTDAQIKKLYKSLLIEQDVESAHRYSLNDEDYKNAIMFDIGAAEGILSLEKIDVLKKVYLVECEQEWVDALNRTFEPYKEKVNIIFKYIDQNDSETSISLNTLGENLKNEKIFLKMDVEGYEKKSLLGGLNLLKNNNCIAAVCTYHNPAHPKEIKEIFESIGYNPVFSKGYIHWANRLSKALIRAKKS
jgi:hypothetical protein